MTGQNTGRDAVVDLLRGYFVAVMIVDHLLSFPSLFEVFSGQGRMWASAAEGFFIVSGYLVGVVRGAEARDGRLREATGKLLRRATQLYLWTVGMTLAYALVGSRLGWTAVGHDAPLVLVVRTLALRFTYERIDVLPVFVLILAAAPFALTLLSAGWASLVVAASLAFWIGGLLMIDPISLTGSSFSVASWQVCFFLAMVVGFHADVVRQSLRRLSQALRRAALVVLASLSGMLGYLSWLDTYRHALWRHHLRLLRFLFDKPRLGPGRLMVAGVWIVLLYSLFKKFEPGIARMAGGFLEPLGRNSLYVYIVQSVLVSPQLNPYTHDLWLATARDAVVLAAVWLMVRKRVLFDWIPR